MHKVPFSALSPFPPAITVAGLMDILPDSLLLLSSSCDTRCYITCFKFKIVAWAFLHGQHLRSASLPRLPQLVKPPLAVGMYGVSCFGLL